MACAISAPRLASGVETVHTGPYEAGGGDVSTQEFFSTVLQCLGTKGVIKDKKKVTPTIEAFAKAYDLVGISSNEKAQRVKKPTKLELDHLLAQILIETGYLDALTEKGKEGEQYSGRGYIQITGKDNYRNCADFIKEIGGPYSSTAASIASGGSAADAVIGNHAFGSGGISSAALTPSALCTLAWWAEAKKNKEFESALTQDGVEAVDTVSRIVNKGPGSSKSDHANNEKEREKAFLEVKSCTK